MKGTRSLKVSATTHAMGLVTAALEKAILRDEGQGWID